MTADERPRLRLDSVVAEDSTTYADVERGDGVVERWPTGPRRLDVRLELTVENPSEAVFAALRRLVGPVDLIPRPTDHPAL